MSTGAGASIAALLRSGGGPPLSPWGWVALISVALLVAAACGALGVLAWWLLPPA